MARLFAGLAVLALLFSSAAQAQHPHEVERQRALIELDRRSAEFARPPARPSAPLPPHVGQPLSIDPDLARELRPYERLREAEEGRGPFVLQLPPPVRQEESGSDPDLAPLPLPGGPQRGVDPVTLPGRRG